MFSKKTMGLKQVLEDEKQKLNRFQVELAALARMDDKIIEDALARQEGIKVENPIATAAKRFFDGENISTISLTTLSADRQDIANKARIIKEAINMQRPVIDGARDKFSTSLGCDLKPKYHEKVVTVAKAVIALVHALNDERKFFIDLMETEDFNYGHAFGTSLQLNIIPEDSMALKKSGSFLHFWLRDVVRAGVLSQKELDHLIERA